MISQERNALPNSCLLLSQMQFWIALLLSFIGYVPGIIYAIYVLLA
jgi:uncharacterized membrane protein YqaE (UPF0057 family)